jgi:DNA-binding response OmpR family regulator
MSEKQGNSQNSKSAQYKLLIVEDNPDLRRFIAESLKDEYELDIAKDGLEGLKRAQAAIPDLILSDVLMPNMDGYQLSNAIRSDDATSHIPIVLLTAKGDDLSRMKGWQEEVDDYLSKPFKMSELKMRIKRLLSVRDILRKKHTSELTNNLATKNDEAISFQTKKDREFFFKFHQIMCENYANERFSRTDAANQLNMSLRQLSRKLEALVDYSFTEYLRKYRLQRSTELLLSGKQVTEVSYDVGFNSPSYFSSCFKAEFGEAPRDYITARQSSSS